MSRSYKKHSVCQSKKDKFFKRYCNKIIRASKKERFKIPNGNFHKRISDTYRIYEYSGTVSSYEEFMKNARGDLMGRFNRDKSDETLFIEWLRYYRIK